MSFILIFYSKNKKYKTKKFFLNLNYLFEVSVIRTHDAYARDLQSRILTTLSSPLNKDIHDKSRTHTLKRTRF
jgi:hypothetical protein